MVLGAELAVVLALLAHLLEALVYHFAEELLGLDERDLDVAVGIAVEGELTGYAVGQRVVDGGVGGGEVLKDVFALLRNFHFGKAFGLGQQVVELGDERLHGGDELDEALGDEDDAVVVAFLGAGGDGLCQVVDNLGEGHILSLDLLADDADVGLALQGALKGDVAGGTAHELDEMPVFLCGVAVALDVADYLAVDLGGGVETEGGLNHLVLEVAVDGLGAADNLDACADAVVVFGQHCGVGVGVVAADDDEGGDAEFLEDFEA